MLLNSVGLDREELDLVVANCEEEGILGTVWMAFEEQVCVSVWMDFEEFDSLGMDSEDPDPVSVEYSNNESGHPERGKVLSLLALGNFGIFTDKPLGSGADLFLDNVGNCTGSVR